MTSSLSVIAFDSLIKAVVAHDLASCASSNPISEFVNIYSNDGSKAKFSQ